MQLLQNNKSANDDADQNRNLMPSTSSDRPNRELMCLVFPDGTVRTVDPEADDD
ncbi:MAG: hypothetical protein AAFV85_06260 [Cyanobacteria bacterium J06634_6]